MMPPKKRKHCQSLLPDMLSNLPDNIIDVILMHLPCKDAVRTSVLSNKWRYHWRRLTELTLDGSLWETNKDKLYPTVKFAKIIYQILTLHEGPITKFTLDISHLDCYPDIDNFISFLSRNGIQQLVLHFSCVKTYKMPSSLFTCSQLRHLNLYGCSIHHPSAFQGFDKLISLELYAVTISSESLKSLISHCPLLENLVLEISREIEIEIDAPMLRSFDFTGDISCICLRNVPRLVEVTLQGENIEAEDLDFTKVFESCPALENLIFDFYSSEFFADEGYEVPKRLPINLNSVKRFYLPDILLVESYKLSYALCLIRSFPSLEYLELQFRYEDDCDSDDESTEESLELKCLSDVTLNHLGEVKLVYFTGKASEMQFIKFLLANSPVLKRILLDRQFLDQGSLDTRLEIFAEVLAAWWFMMPPKKGNQCQSLLPDMLSNLPDNLVDAILLLLPSKDAVKTSVLSKKWRYHWCRLTELTLDGFLWKTKKDNLHPTAKFTKIIYPIVTLHEGPITKFTLSVYHLERCPEIDNFISFLSRKNIQHLVLHLPCRNKYKMPSSLLACSQLRYLNLHYCSIHHLSAFQGFDKLISLELRGVTVSSELLKSLISRPPLLEQLVLESLDNLGTIEINAPMLRSFHFRGNITLICLKNVPRLVKVTLLAELHIMNAKDLDLSKIFESCSALEHLSLDIFKASFFDVGEYEAPRRLPLKLNCVKRFYLSRILLLKSYKLSCAFCLIRSFPCLEYLEIQFEYAEHRDAEDSLDLNHLSDMTFNHLREVKLINFSGRSSEMKFIKFLLANSPMFERMLLFCREYPYRHSLFMRSKIFAEVSKFSRASPEAEIVFFDFCRLRPLFTS